MKQKFITIVDDHGDTILINLKKITAIEKYKECISIYSGDRYWNIPVEQAGELIKTLVLKGDVEIVG